MLTNLERFVRRRSDKGSSKVFDILAAIFQSGKQADINEIARAAEVGTETVQRQYQRFFGQRPDSTIIRPPHMPDKMKIIRRENHPPRPARFSGLRGRSRK